MTNEPRRYRNISLAVTNSSQDAYTCPANTTTIVREIIVSNIDGTNSADTTIQFYNGSTAYELAHTVPVPADSTLIVLGKDAPIYLEEGHIIRGSASAASDLQVVISYEELDDA